MSILDNQKENEQSRQQIYKKKTPPHDPYRQY